MAFQAGELFRRNLRREVRWPVWDLEVLSELDRSQAQSVQESGENDNRSSILLEVG